MTAPGKRTLVVRWGGARAARLYQVALAAPYLWLLVAVPPGLPVTVAVGVLLPAPLALWLITRMSRGMWRDPARWEALAFLTVALLVVTSAAELLAVIWSCRR